MRRTVIGVTIGVVILLILLGVAIYLLLQPATPTDKIRDIFIIVVALESLVIGVALDRVGRAIGKPHQPVAKRGQARSSKPPTIPSTTCAARPSSWAKMLLNPSSN